MVDLLTRYLVVIFGSVLATYVFARARGYLPAHLLVLVLVLLVGLSINSSLRQSVSVDATAYLLSALNVLLLGLIVPALLLLLSRLFVPEWWQGAKPIRWIILPYLLPLVILLVDLTARTGLVFDGVREVAGQFQLRSVWPAAGIFLALFNASWIVHIGVLVTGFIRQPRQRGTIALLVGGLFLSIANALIAPNIAFFAPVQSLLTALPVMGTLAYTVLRTRLLLPTQAAFDLAVEAIRDVILVLGLEGEVVYANPAAQRLGLAAGKPLGEELAATGLADRVVPELISGHSGEGSSGIRLTLAGRQLVVEGAPVRNLRGEMVGRLLMGRDVTELEQRSVQLEAERSRLAATVEQLEAEQAGRAALAATVRAMALPVIPVQEGVLVLPLVGEFDDERAEDLIVVLLQAIKRECARLVLLDITGVPLLDTAGAATLLRATRAAALLGARCMLVGVRPEIAQTLVALGVSFDGLSTAATLQQGLHNALNKASKGSGTTR